MQFSPIPYHFIPLRSKYSPQHPVLKYRQTIILNFSNRWRGKDRDDKLNKKRGR
jgi:hypothetical protein